MADSILPSIFSVWNKLQDKLSSAASPGNPCEVPRLTKLNDMVYEVYTPPEERPKVDIVFFHGLQFGDSKDAYVKTWMARDNSQLWIQTWLVELFPTARILTVTYDSSAEKIQEFGNLDMYCTAENLVASLIADEVRVGKAGTPVVFVGHCLGGLVLKELCLSAAWMGSLKSEQGSGMGRIKDLLSNLRGMFYYGTPHVGSLLGDKLHDCFKGELLEEMETLKASSARRNQNFDYLRSKYGWITSGMGELHKTYVEFLGTDIHIVPEASSRYSMDSYYSANADHYDICKAEGKNSCALQQLGNFISTILQSPRLLQAGLVADAENNTEFFIDLEGRARQVRSMLARTDVNQIFIVGLSGLGKTSLARQVYQSIGDNFDAKCFVSLDSIVGQSNGSEHVWRNIQEGLGEGHIRSNLNLSQLLYQLKSQKVLIILDNVESQSQIDVLRIGAWLEGSSSKLIVTSTTDRLGTPSNTFRVGYLRSEESLQLFRHYAFQSREEPHALRDIVEQVIAKCDGYPLFVKVLAGFVSKESTVHDKQVWLDLLKRLEKAEDVDGGPDYRLWAKLKVCYNALLPSEQEIFLDIAVIFHGFPLSLVKRIWRVARDEPDLAWSNLKSRFLVSASDYGRIEMHAQLRNLGQNIASPHKASLEKWRRISGHYLSKELQDKLVSKNTGIMETLALKLNLVENDVFKLKKAVFHNYDQLQYLILEGGRASTVTFWSKVKLPRSLVYLRWKDGSFTGCPLDFTGSDKLVVLELLDCKSMKSLPPSIVKARRLTWLELEGCSSLRELPEGLSKDLQHIGLERTGLRKLPDHCQNFKELVDLNASQTKLTQIPQGLAGLEMLTRLNLRETGVTTLPDFVGDLKRLEYLNLSGTMLTSLPESIGQLGELRELDLSRTMLSSLPGSIGLLKGLKRLILQGSKLRSVPESIGQLGELRELELQKTMLSSLPESIGQLGELEDLDLSNTMLSSLPDSISLLKGLRSLILSGSKLRCFSESLHLSFGDLAKLEQLNLDDTPLEALPDSVGKLSRLSNLLLSDTPISALPETIADLPVLSVLHLPTLQSLPQRLPRVRILHVDIGALFKSLESEQARSEGEDCATIDWPSESAIDALLHQALPSQGLVELRLRGRGYPQSGVLRLFLALQKKTSLLQLHLHDFNLIETIPCELGELSGLLRLGLYGFETLRELPESLCKLNELTDLLLHDIPSLRRLPECLSALSSLSTLSLLDVPSLRRLPESLSALSSLTWLCVWDWRALATTCSLHARMQCSWSHATPTLERKSSTSKGNVCRSSDSLEPTSPPQLQLKVLHSDVWGLVECFLERGGKLSSEIIYYYANCKEFEKARKMAKVCRIGEYELPTKMIMKSWFGRESLDFSVVPWNFLIRNKCRCKSHRNIEIRVRDGS